MLLKRLVFIGSLLLLTTFVFSQKEYDPDKVYSVSQLQEDFDLFYTAFYEEHPGWGYYHPADSMQAWFEATQKKIDHPMTEREFRHLLYPLVAKLGCGHTRIKMPSSYSKYLKKRKKAGTLNNYLPLIVKKVNGKLMVIHNYLPDSTLIPPGSEIIGIDGKSATTIIKEIESMFPADGYNTTHRERVLNYDFTGYYGFYYGQKKSYQVEVRYEEGKVFKLDIDAHAVTRSDYAKANRTYYKQFAPEDSIILKKKGYQLRLLKDQENTALLKINRFAGRKGKRFYRKTFKYLDSNQIPNLVIDLRDNGGGSGKEALTLVAYINDEEVKLFGKKKRKKPKVSKHLSAGFARAVLFPVFMPISFKSYKEGDYLHMGFHKKPKKNNFDGRVFTLFNGISFSSSVIVGAYLKEQGNLISIGQETGGCEAGTNAFQMPRLRLPNTKVEMVYPLFRVNSDTSAEDIGRGIMPDYPIEYSLMDLLEGRDLEVEKVKELVE